MNTLKINEIQNSKFKEGVEIDNGSKEAFIGSPSKAKRLHYIDNLRVFLTVLVVLHHTAITYGARGSWYYFATYYEGLNDSFTSILLTIVAAINATFFMAAFFLLSGYFTPSSYDRKGSLKYLKDRFIRLGIPLLIHIIIIGPFIAYYMRITLNRRNQEISILEFYSWVFESGRFFGVGPLWFVQALLILAICYSIWRVVNKKVLYNKTSEYSEGQGSHKMKFPDSRQIFLLIALLGILTFIVRIFIPSDYRILYLPLGDFVLYIGMFILGGFAYRQNLFSQITESYGKFWMKVTLGAIIFLLGFVFLTGAFEGDLSVYQGGFRWESLLGSVWSSIMCISICISLIPAFRSKLNSQGTFAKILAQNAYTVYIIHAPVLVVTSISVSEVSFFHPLLKFFCVLCMTLILCFVTSYFVLRRIPGAKKVLG
ncbi:MAG: acyltransferase family protein [Candidatus Hodarchaeota archaeon]